MKHPFCLVVLFLTGLFLTSSCTSTSTSKLISIEDYTFARADESVNLNPVASPSTFQKGEKVHLVLLHVGPFKKDSTGLNWFDMDIHVSGPDGTEINSGESLLGESGHIDLPENYAKSPFASFQTDESMQSGKYKFTVTIYDRIGKGKATLSAFFNLE
ncbi:MAG: hypothetical protein ACPLXM_01845 [Bacteroidales bacterium]